MEEKEAGGGERRVENKAEEREGMEEAGMNEDGGRDSMINITVVIIILIINIINNTTIIINIIISIIFYVALSCTAWPLPQGTAAWRCPPA